MAVVEQPKVVYAAAPQITVAKKDEKEKKKKKKKAKIAENNDGKWTLMADLVHFTRT